MMKSPDMQPEAVKRASLQDPLKNSPSLMGNTVFKSPIPQNQKPNLPIQMAYNMVHKQNQQQP